MSDRVLVIIDDPFELSTVGAALKLHGINVVGEARKKNTALNLFRSLQPNILLLDMHKSQECSIDIAVTIRKESPTIGIVILVPCADVRLIGKQLSELPAGTLLVLKKYVSAMLIETMLPKYKLNKESIISNQPNPSRNSALKITEV